MDTPHCINLGGPLNTLSRSPDGNHVIVAGRDVLKIVSIKDSLKHVQSLRVAKMNLNFTGNDCAWHPMEAYKHTIATAATNGAVVVWNISKEGQARQERIINDHTRAVNRLSWHPENGQLLLSGSQDGSMKLWDFRDPSQNCCKLTFHGKSDSVRDVQFSPHWTNYFAAAFDNGTLQIWDIRGKTQQYERKITAHQGVVLCVDWHPEEKSLLATGGRDRTVKVWDLSSKAGVPIHTIQTISSVSRVKWRPEHKYHIASCAGLMDFHVHIWDARKPYIPLGSLGKHRDVATGILWTSKYSMLSCGKDSTLIKHDTAEAIRPVIGIRTAAISWAVNNEVSVANDPVIRADIHDLTPSNIPAAPPLFSDKNAGVVKVFAAFGTFKELGPAMDSIVFKYLAENYKLFGAPVPDLCDHNSSIASSVKQFQVAQVWQLIKLFYEPLEHTDIENNNESIYSVVDPPPVELPSPGSRASTESDYDEPVLADVAKSLESELLYNDITDQFLSSEAVTPLSPLPVRAPSLLLTGDSNSPSRSPGTPPRERAELPLVAHPQLIDDTILKRNFGSQNSSASTTPLPSRPATPKTTVAQIHNGIQDTSPPMWDFKESIYHLLENYAEKGDVQNCVAVCMVLRDKLEVDKELLLKWFTAYIDLLQRHQLWSIANIHVKECSLQSISKLNQQSTTIHTGCPHCAKPLFAQGWACEKCNMLTAQCSVCRQPVKGMYVWCQGCGHGGHLSHIREWFQVQGQKLCPSGCAHYCVYKPHPIM